MEILFTTNEQVGSKIIRWVTRGVCSHVAILLDSGVVIHSTAGAGGVHLNWLETFMQQNRVVDHVQLADSPELIARLRAVEGKGYDWGLLLSMGLRRLGIPVPEVDNPRLDLCTEVVTEYVFGKTDMNLSPEELRVLMKGNV